MDPAAATYGPFELGGMGTPLRLATAAVQAVAMAAVVVGSASLVARHRRSVGVERQQLRWIAVVAAMTPFGAIVLLFGLVTGRRPVVEAAVLAAGVAIVVAIGAATIRLRLYDVDRILNRTVVYGLLTVLLGGGYAVVVLGVGRLVGPRSDLLVACATLAVAAVFRPARRRMQMAVDQRFNRAHFDAATTVEAFSARVREQVDLETLTADLVGVVGGAMQPTQVSLLLRARPTRAGRS